VVLRWLGALPTIFVGVVMQLWRPLTPENREQKRGPGNKSRALFGESGTRPKKQSSAELFTESSNSPGWSG
jgi:hypothetical protein